jgi:hypothetical protein
MGLSDVLTALINCRYDTVPCIGAFVVQGEVSPTGLMNFCTTGCRAAMRFRQFPGLVHPPEMLELHSVPWGSDITSGRLFRMCEALSHVQGGPRHLTKVRATDNLRSGAIGRAQNRHAAKFPATPGDRLTFLEGNGVPAQVRPNNSGIVGVGCADNTS